jgi:hypothetical protein
MSGTGATVGDVYEVFRGIVKDVVAFGPKRKRPIVCVAENRHRPAVAYWRGVSRTSSRPIQGNDVLASPAQHERGLDKAGHWQFRWVHEVLKSKVGTPSCVLLGSLSAEERKAVLKRYKNRLNNSDVIP